ncbi:MAG: hypothetical protein R3277_03915 [Brumimicrobium sp.]|nr:hypothetical protein [Brumimicrobium sp.]
MIRAIRENNFFNLLCGIFALFLLNLSAETIDKNPSHLPEDLTVNDQESIVEIILEKILGYENAISEHEDNDTGQRGKKSSFKPDLASIFIPVAEPVQILSADQSFFPDPDLKLSLGFLRITVPPPILSFI